MGMRPDPMKEEAGLVEMEGDLVGIDVDLVKAKEGLGCVEFAVGSHGNPTLDPFQQTSIRFCCLRKHNYDHIKYTLKTTESLND